jgi:hypothetical protein
MKARAMFHGWAFVAASIVLIGVALLGVTVWSSGSRSPQIDRAPVGNKTQALEVVSAEKTKDGLRLLLRNISDKNINAVA